MSIRESVQVPASFAMFTTAGNRRLQTLAGRLLVDLEKVHATDFGSDFYVEGKGPRTAEKKAYRRFFEAYQKMSGFASYREAGDTAVREAVWCFAVDAAAYSGYVPQDELDEVWHAASYAVYVKRMAS